MSRNFICKGLCWAFAGVFTLFSRLFKWWDKSFFSFSLSLSLFIVKIYFLFLEPIQLVSIPISFISLVWASIKLFYFQRLGPYSDHDPSIKMILSTSLPIIFLLFGNLYSLILISSYYQLWILLVIGLSFVVQCIVLKATYLKKPDMIHIIKQLYNGNKEFGTKETNNIFWMSVLISWVAPCTVWANNTAMKTRFILSSSRITIAVNMLSITAVFICVNTVGLMENVNPPISHCYKPTYIFNERSYYLYDSSNSSHKLFRSSGSLPMIRICSENESLFKNFDFWCYLTGISLLFFSWVASALLQVLGNNDKMPPVEFQISCTEPFKKVCKPFVTWFQKILNPVTSVLKNMFQCTHTLSRICNYRKKKNIKMKKTICHQCIEQSRKGNMVNGACIVFLED